MRTAACLKSNLADMKDSIRKNPWRTSLLKALKIQRRPKNTGLTIDSTSNSIYWYVYYVI